MRTLAAAGLIAVLGLTACGGSGSGGGRSGGDASAVDVLRASSEKTTDAGTARIALDVQVAQAGAGAGKAIAIKGEGVLDFAGRLSQLQLTLPQAGSIEVRQLGTTIYTKLPPALAKQAGGKAWVKLDLTQAAAGQGGGLADLFGGSSDPAQTLEYLRGIGTEVREVGTEQVRDAQTTHYSGTVDLAKAAAAAPAESRKALQQAIEQVGGATVPVEVWVDDQGRTRKMVTTVPLPAGPTGASAAPSSSPGKVSATVELFDFGAPADVTAPPAGEVTDLTSQLNQGGGASPQASAAA